MAAVTGAVLDLRADWAKLGLAPGNNVDPTGTWDDISGNANDGTLQTFAYTTASGWAGAGNAADPYRLQFDGASDYVLCTDLQVADDKVFTYEVWALMPAAPASAHLMNEWGGAAAGYCALAVDATTGYTRLIIRFDSQVNYYDSRNLCDGGVHHLVGVSDGTNGRYYVDNVLRSGPAALPAGSIVTNSTTVGCYLLNGTSPAGYFPGAILVARMYSTALTAPQVSQNYAAGYRTWGMPPCRAGIHRPIAALNDIAAQSQ